MKMTITYESLHYIGEPVFLALPDGEQGIVSDIRHNYRSGLVEYLIVFGRRSEDEVWCTDELLSTVKVF